MTSMLTVRRDFFCIQPTTAVTKRFDVVFVRSFVGGLRTVAERTRPRKEEDERRKEGLVFLTVRGGPEGDAGGSDMEIYSLGMWRRCMFVFRRIGGWRVR